MSRKRSGKPLFEVSGNEQAKKQKINTKPNQATSTIGLESFIPLEHTAPEHSAKVRLPADTELTPLAFFSLFWSKSVLDPIVQATNIYAQQKRSRLDLKRTKCQKPWKPLTIPELQGFLSISILRGIIKLPTLLSRWKSREILLPERGISLTRYMQIKRYLHISVPPQEASTKLLRKDWWKKLEPLSSYLQERSQELYLPATNVAVDEMMVNFTGRSTHTIRMPGKPIPVGYKILAICDNGYTLNWLYTSRVDSVASLIKQPNLSPTTSAVFQLCSILDTHRRYVVYMDNAFSTIPLFRELRKLSIGAVGTTRINSPELPDVLKDKTMTCWNTLTGCVAKARDTQAIAASGNLNPSPDVLCLRWEDNNIVRFLTTIHNPNEYILSERRKPRTTSTNAIFTRQVFGNQERKVLPIPKIVNDYNHHMNSVDLADQRRAAYTTHVRACRNWLCLFYFLLDISLVNAHILYIHTRQEEFNRKLDNGDIRPDQILLHELARPYSVELFRRQLIRQLALPSSLTSRQPKRIQVRRTYKKKSNQLYFSKYNPSGQLQQATRQGVGDSGLQHKLQKITSRRSCCICRQDHRAGDTGGRRRPKLTSFECPTCSPPIALCGPESSSCFTRWHACQG